MLFDQLNDYINRLNADNINFNEYIIVYDKMSKQIELIKTEFENSLTKLDSCNENIDENVYENVDILELDRELQIKTDKLMNKDKSFNLLYDISVLINLLEQKINNAQLDVYSIDANDTISIIKTD